MSYFLWNSMPDEALMAAAAAGELDHVEGVEAQAWRMLEDDRAATAWAHFHHQWLGLERLETVAPDPESYPSWSPALRVSMEVETHDFVVETLRGSDPTFRALLVGRETHADATLADLYDLSAGETSLDPRERAGVLTRSAWLTATSHPVHPSPVQRGVFVLERMLCTPVSSPPADVNTEIAPPVEAMTNRERYAQHTADPACAGCHTAIDPLGFAFENYDSIGRHRVMDYGLGIDASGVFTEGDLAGVGFEDGVSISEQMASSQTVHDCFVRHWLRSAHGADLPPDDLGRSFSDTGGHIPQLLVDIVRSERFRSLR